MRKLKKGLLIGLSLSLLVSSLTLTNAATQNVQNTEIKNVIFLIPDGMSTAGTTLARWYNGGKPLAMDEMASGLVKTYWAAGPITDSAPAATALATGYKSTENFISVAPDKIDIPGYTPKSQVAPRMPVATVLEGAKLAGKSTGLIATSEISHATPACFAAHTASRKEEENITEQLLNHDVDVVLGGSTFYMTAENRKDGEDLISEAKEKGYDYVTTPEAMMNSKSNKLWASFANMDLSYDFDRKNTVEPSLEQMTTKAINVLSKNKNGFFLMVEGSKIDWAAHGNDTVGVISDVLAFDKAVKAALDFAKKDKHTIVIACTDHGNGGITIGNSNTNSNYSSVALDAFISPLKKASLTAEGVAIKIYENKTVSPRVIIAGYYGLSDITDEEYKLVEAALKLDADKNITNGKESNVKMVLAQLLNKRANIGWDTTGHTGEDVTLYTYAPNGQRLTGVVENTQIAEYISMSLGFRLEEVSKKLFIDASEAFRAKGATVTVDYSDINNLVMTVEKGEDTYTFHVNKNYAFVNDEEVALRGTTVFTDKFYVSEDAVALVK